MTNYNISNLLLTNINYNFTKPDKSRINVCVNDAIKIHKINDKQVDLFVSRVLNFGENTNTYLNIVYEVSLEFSKEMSKEETINLLAKKTSGLTPVFSKISLLISQITNSSPFGVIVTPPIYDPKEAIIE